MNIIPAIDLINGELVRLYKGDYEKKTVYPINPIDTIKYWERIGISNLHLVDLQGALLGEQKNLSSIKDIKLNTRLKIQIGGGIRNMEACKKMLDLGVAKVIFGTASVTAPEEIKKSVENFGTDKIIVGIDVKNKNIQINGWTETTNFTPENLIAEMMGIGVSQFMFTDVNKDGTLSEPDFKYLHNLSTLAGGKTIVAGGISSIDHLNQLKKFNIKNAVIGKAIYEGQINLKKAVKYFMGKS